MPSHFHLFNVKNAGSLSESANFNLEIERFAVHSFSLAIHPTLYPQHTLKSG